jgi:hypothetical protein
MIEHSNDDVAEPHDSMIDVINVYKKDVDRTLLRANLRLTVEERLLKAQSFHLSIDGWRTAGQALHRQKDSIR